MLSQPCRSCSCVVSRHVFMKLFYEQIKWWWSVRIDALILLAILWIAIYKYSDGAGWAYSQPYAVRTGHGFAIASVGSNNKSLRPYHYVQFISPVGGRIAEYYATSVQSPRNNLYVRAVRCKTFLPRTLSPGYQLLKPKDFGPTNHIYNHIYFIHSARKKVLG